MKLPNLADAVIEESKITAYLLSDEHLPLVRVVWIVDSGGVIPRLVTAYPIEGDAT